MNNTSTRTEILEALENIDSVTMESSFDVMFTMADSYDKAAVILENYNGSDLSAFAIFQEDGEGENKTAVQQGDASGDVNAEAKKQKQNIFVKIWNFIKNIFKTFGQWIKKCWSGVTFSEIYKGSDETNRLLDSAEGKSESEFVTFVKQQIGIDISEFLTFGGAAIGLGALASGIAMENPLTAIVGGLIGVGMVAGGTKLWMKIRSTDVTTNIKAVAINWAMKTVVSLLVAIAKASSNPEGLKKAKRSFLDGIKNMKDHETWKGGFVTPDDQPATYTHQEMVDLIKIAVEDAKQLDDVKDFNVDAFVKMEETTANDSQAIAEDKEMAKEISLWGKCWLAIQKAWKVVYDFLTKIGLVKKKVDEAIENKENTPKNPEAVDTEKQNETSAEAETKPDTEKKAEDASAPDDWGDGDDGFNESAKTEIVEDDTTVSEAATWYNRF